MHSFYSIACVVHVTVKALLMATYIPCAVHRPDQSILAMLLNDQTVETKRPEDRLFFNSISHMTDKEFRENFRITRGQSLVKKLVTVRLLI